MLPLNDAWLSWGAERLIAGSVQGAIAAGVVWVVCRRVTSIPPSVRALAWWLVSLKLLMSFASFPSLAIPVLPTPQLDRAGIVARDSQALDASTSRARAAVASQEPERNPASPARFWLMGGMGLWLLGVSLHAVRLLTMFVQLRRTLRHSSSVGDEEAAIAGRLARSLGLRVAPDVRVSERIETPLVVGLLRPTVLLPAHAETRLTIDERAMAICHELAHVRRRDLLLGWVPAIAERLFFFHPLARFAAREYAAEREAACDALVMQALDVAPRDYGQMLVRLGVSGLTPVFTASGSSPSRSVLRRRLAMLNDVTLTHSRRAIVLIALISAAAIVPFHLVAREAPQAAAPTVAAPTVAAPTVAAPTVAAPSVAAPSVARPVPTPQAAAPKPAPARVADAEQLQKAVEEQRARLRETERALNKMRLALEELLAQQARLSVGADSQRQVEVERVAEDLRRRAEELRRVDVQRTDQFLQEQLRALTAEQGKIRAALQALSDQIEQIRKHIEKSSEAERLVNPRQ